VANAIPIPIYPPLLPTEGDRKAYFETSQWTMKQNKDTIAASKKENKDLLTQLAEKGR
jgi:hypothetical protein